MPAQTILILNPGAMGAAIGARLAAKGHQVLWVRSGRSAQSVARAEAAGLLACDSLKEALNQADIVLSVCPPHAALEVAREVAAYQYAGWFVDANAVAPQSAMLIGDVVVAGGARFTDGGIIGPPPVPGANTRLYLSGTNAAELAEILNASPLTAIPLDREPTAASALKMCFAGWNKARSALLLNLRALATHHSVDEALVEEWAIMDPGVLELFDKTSGRSVMGSAAKAWRWSGEMTEIAKTFEQAGLPGGFHHGAAEVFSRLERFKDADEPPALSEITQRLPKT